MAVVRKRVLVSVRVPVMFDLEVALDNDDDVIIQHIRSQTSDHTIRSIMECMTDEDHDELLRAAKARA